MPGDNEFIPLDGPEIIEAVVEDIRRVLLSRHDLFAKHLAYPRVDWTFELDLDFYHTQESLASNGAIGNTAERAGELVREQIKHRCKVHAPDAVREELLGKTPRIQEDKGDAARILTSPQNDGIIRISRP